MKRLREFGRFSVLEGGTYRARLIREGVSKNGNLWTRAILEKMIRILPGTPVNFYDMSESADGSFLAHWATLRAKLPPAIASKLPETLPGATVGRITNPILKVVNGVGEVHADVVPEPSAGWFQQFLTRARNLGLSIFVPEDGMSVRPHSAGGWELTDLTKIGAFDVVSFPSAGGAFLPVLEAVVKEETQVKLKDLVKRLLRALPQEKRERLLESIDAPPDTVQELGVLLEEHEEFANALLEAFEIKPTDPAIRIGLLEGIYRVAPAEDPAPKPKPKPKTKMKPAPVAVVEEEEEEEEDDDVDLNVIARQHRELLRENSEAMLESVLAASNLPKPTHTFVQSHFNAILESEGRLRKKDVTSFVENFKKSLGAGRSVLEDSGQPRVVHNGPWTNGERAVVAFDAMLAGKEFDFIGEGDKKEKVPAFRGIRQAYGVLTGDVHCMGHEFYTENNRVRGALESVNVKDNAFMQQYRVIRGGLSEAEMTTASFPLLLSDRMHKAMLREYLEQTFMWRLVAAAENVSDFKTWRYLRVGEMPNLAVVAEGGAYNDLGTMPSEEEITLQIEKRGGTFTFTWEAIVNDELGKFRDFPRKAARAADRTLNTQVFTLMAGNAAIYDAVALAHATHTNLTASALSWDNLKSMRRKMHLQKDLNTREAGRVAARHLICGPSTFDQAYELLFSDGKPRIDTNDPNTALGTAKVMVNDNSRMPNLLRSKYGLDLWETFPFEDIDADQYWLTGDVGEVDMIKVGFFQGRQNPEMFVQDLDRVGSFFTNEKVIHKIRHIYKSVVVDYRPFQGGIP